jgi:hypothetical protein
MFFKEAVCLIEVVTQRGRDNLLSFEDLDYQAEVFPELDALFQDSIQFFVVDVKLGIDRSGKSASVGFVHIDPD